jgi:hypothetical protein
MNLEMKGMPGLLLLMGEMDGVVGTGTKGELSRLGQIGAERKQEKNRPGAIGLRLDFAARLLDESGLKQKHSIAVVVGNRGQSQGKGRGIVDAGGGPSELLVKVQGWLGGTLQLQGTARGVG